jgi:galactokinase
VLPFTTSGLAGELLGEGLVDLLSTNLDEVGAIRTIDPRTVLHRWRQAAAGGSLDQEGALRVGRAVGADSVLLGNVVEAAGLPDRAALLCSRFLRFWENADPELQPHVDAARRALERLTAEGAAAQARR